MQGSMAQDREPLKYIKMVLSASLTHSICIRYCVILTSLFLAQDHFPFFSCIYLKEDDFQFQIVLHNLETLKEEKCFETCHVFLSVAAAAIWIGGSFPLGGKTFKVVVMGRNKQGIWHLCFVFSCQLFFF